MDKTKQLLIAFGSLAALVFLPVVIYFFSMLTACATSTAPKIISCVLGGIILLAAIISYFIFKNKLCIITILLALIAGGVPTIFLNNRFSHHNFHNGYIQGSGSYDSYTDEYGNFQSQLRYKYYNKFGLEVFYGTEEEAQYYLYGYIY